MNWKSNRFNLKGAFKSRYFRIIFTVLNYYMRILTH